jgi:uncharacterized membrane protein
MSVPSVPAGRFTPGDFRVGQVFSRTWSVFSRNFLTFVPLNALASLPELIPPRTLPNPGAVVVVFLLILVFGTLVHAILLYAALQVMRGRPIDLAASARIGLRRFFPIMGITIVVPVLGGLATLLLVFPGLMLFTTWFVATPVCVAEQLGVVDSMERSRELTKGYRWKIFGLLLLLLIPLFIVSAGLGVVMVAGVVAQIVRLIWDAVWSAFFAILIVVTYYDLRVAKEGIGTDQIAAVFE